MRRARVRGRASGRWFSLAVLLAVGACRVGAVETTPLRGPSPRAVLVLPPRNGTVVPDRSVRGLASFVDDALRERGYRVLPLDVGFDLARKYGAPSPGEDDVGALQRLRLQAGVDAVLILDVRVWDVTPGRGVQPESASWDMVWRLVATGDGGLQWEQRQQGSWVAGAAERLDPTRAIDAEPLPATIGGERPPQFRSERELLRALHRTALARLPRGES
ncbi:MAG: GNA1162 family protein [Planctomycetota bacterium]